MLTVRSRYYVGDAGDGTVDTSIEHMLCDLEGAAMQQLHRLDKGKTLNREERAIVAEYVALAMVRVPKMARFTAGLMTQQSLGAMQKIAEDARLQEQFETATGVTLNPEELAAVRAFGTGMEASFEDDSIAIMVNLHAALSFARIILEMGWTLLVPGADCSFIMSDVPVNLTVPGDPPLFQGAMAHERLELTMPITPRTCLLMRHVDGPDVVSVDREIVEMVNLRQVRGADIMVFSGQDDEAIAQLIAQRVALGDSISDDSILQQLGSAWRWISPSPDNPRFERLLKDMMSEASNRFLGPALAIAKQRARSGRLRFVPRVDESLEAQKSPALHLRARQRRSAVASPR